MTADLAAQSEALAAAWSAEARALATAGADSNARYLTKDEAFQALYTQILSGLEFTADTRLGRPLGERDRPRPTRAEFWRTARPLPNALTSAKAAVRLRRFSPMAPSPRPRRRSIRSAEPGWPSTIRASNARLDRGGLAHPPRLRGRPGRGRSASPSPPGATPVAATRPRRWPLPSPAGPGTTRSSSTARGTVRQRLSPPEGRHCNGHGTLLAEGAILATSEQDATTSEGYVGLWDATDGFGRIGETPAGGIGPHDLKRLPSGRVIVANGGIGTDPIDRTRLNLATMRPKLARLDPLGGGVVEVTELDPALLPLSIRHLALHPDGTVAFATQWEGDPEGLVPLLGLLALHGSNMLAEPLKPEARFMRGYAGSISWSGSGAEVAITSPTGGWAQRFDAAGRYLGTVTRPEVCGIAPLGPGFLLSDGLGGLVAVEDGTALPLGRAEVAWDTHLVAI